MYGFWDMKRDGQNSWRYYHLHMCTINNNHIMYGSWDMDCDRQFFVILDNFLSFYPPKNLKNQNFEKLKKSTWRYYHFTNASHKWESYDVWFLRYQVQQTDFFANYFALLPSLKIWRIKTLKRRNKKPLEILSFYMSVPKIMIIYYPVLRYGLWRM